MPRPPEHAIGGAGRGAAVLAVLSVAQFTTTLEFSIVYVALPGIAADLGLSPEATQGVVGAYAVLFAGFLVVGGRVADRVGAGRVFLGAVVAFGLTSAVAATAPDGTVLLGARAAQGLAAALLQPAVLGLLQATFPGAQRSRAVAVWSSVGAAGLAVGVLAGGLLSAVSWRLTFAVNVPLALLCAVGGALVLPRGRRSAAPVPVLGAVLGTTTVVALVLALSGAPLVGLVGVVAGIAFVRHERRARTVLVDRALRGLPTLRVGAAATALYMASVGATYYLLTLLLQQLRGFGPLAAGVAFLPPALMVTVGGLVAGRLGRRWRPASVLLVGFATATVGLVGLCLALPVGGYVVLLPGLVVSGLGNGAVYTAMFVLGSRHVPPAHQGTAGALLSTSQHLASAVALAVLALVLGPTPSTATFVVAFGLTALVAAGATVLMAVHRCRATS